MQIEDKANKVRSIRTRLKRSWIPFFARFGRLTDVQMVTIPIILDGHNVIVSSPTATGKTEAIVAPVAELVSSQQTDTLAMLYIVPTRALANDTLERIGGPLEEMGIRTTLKHGDKPVLPSKLPDCLITTPESLDSLICRKPDFLSCLKILIIDEIHLIDNSYRGDQMRILKSRLARLNGDHPYSTHLLSATLGNPTEIASRYIENFTTVVVPGQRGICSTFVNGPEELIKLVKDNKWRKVLCFCNRRKSVEELANTLSNLWQPYPVVAHHGSLGKDAREYAEETMKTSRVAVCVATSTLEIGIDIGDIDVIVLADPPWSMAALYQRLGRGNRRTETIQAIAMASTDEEQFVLSQMFLFAEKGELESEPYNPDLSVVVQQVFSILFAHPQGVGLKELTPLLKDLANEDIVQEILDHLESKSWIERKGNRLFASTEVMDMGEKGKIHSNIPDQQERTVTDASNGREIGKLTGIPDDVFLLAGKAWKIVSIERSSIKVKHYGGQAFAPKFSPRFTGGAFARFLPTRLQAISKKVDGWKV